MSLTRRQEATLAIRLSKWSRALARAIGDHGVPNSFGVLEIPVETNLVWGFNPRNP